MLQLYGKRKTEGSNAAFLKGRQQNENFSFLPSKKQKFKTSKNKFKFKVEKEAHECSEGTIRIQIREEKNNTGTIGMGQLDTKVSTTSLIIWNPKSYPFKLTRI